MADPFCRKSEAAAMSYVNPKLKPQFESLSQGLQDEILSRNVSIHSLYDLIGVLEEIVSEAEGEA